MRLFRTEGVRGDTGVVVGLDAGLAQSYRRKRRPRAGRRPTDLVGVAGVQHRELDAGGGADDLGRQGRATHAAEHHVVDAVLAQLGADGRNLSEQRAGAAVQADPGQSDLRLGLRLGAPQRRVLGEQLAGGPRRRRPRSR